MLSFRISPILGIAVAQAPPAGQKNNDVKRKARQLFKKGERAYKDGEVEKALSKFKESYALVQNYVTLYNIGICLKELGRLKEAIEIFKQFLKVRLASADPKENQKEIDQVNRDIAEFEAIEADIEKKIREAEAKDKKPAPQPPAPTPKPQPQPQPQTQPSKVQTASVPPPYRKWATWTAFVLSAASAAAGAVSILKARERAQTHGNLVEEWKASGQIVCKSGECRPMDKAGAGKLQGLENDVDKYNRFGVIALSTAAASLALGSALMLFGKPQQKPKVSLAPAIGDQFGLGLSIEF